MYHTVSMVSRLTHMNMNPDTRYQIPDTRYGARRMYFPDTRYQIPYSFYGIWIQIPDTRYQIRRARTDVTFRYQIPDTIQFRSNSAWMWPWMWFSPANFSQMWFCMWFLTCMARARAARAENLTWILHIWHPSLPDSAWMWLQMWKVQPFLHGCEPDVIT